MRGVLAAILTIGLSAQAAVAACGQTEGACQLPSGEYHLALPDHTVAAPVVMFLHGAGSSGAQVMRNTPMVGTLLNRGYAVLAPTGSRGFGNGTGKAWAFRSDWAGRNEAGFLREVVQDAAQRFGIDQKRVLLSGFSNGGFMVYYLACAAPKSFAAYASVAGGFWRPHPQACKGPVKLFHTHGWMDKTVPLEGRYLRGASFSKATSLKDCKSGGRPMPAPRNDLTRSLVVDPFGGAPGQIAPQAARWNWRSFRVAIRFRQVGET